MNEDAPNKNGMCLNVYTKMIPDRRKKKLCTVTNRHYMRQMADTTRPTVPQHFHAEIKPKKKKK